MLVTCLPAAAARSVGRPLVPAPSSSSSHHKAPRRQVTTCSLLSKLFGSGDQAANMGSSGSKAAEGWQPGTADTPRRISKSGYDITPMTVEERITAAAPLTDFQRYVALNAGTERAFTGKTVDGSSHDNKRKGIYVSAVGGLPLFSSDAKYDSGTGWPSFFKPIDPEHVIEVPDSSIPFMPRVEVLDARSGAHLGHVFTDGPRPTGRRYCMNAAALRFIPEGEPLPPESQPVQQRQ